MPKRLALIIAASVSVMLTSTAAIAQPNLWVIEPSPLQLSVINAGSAERIFGIAIPPRVSVADGTFSRDGRY